MYFLKQTFEYGDFGPSGNHLWDTRLFWLHVVSDSLIALSYFTIAVTLLWIIRKRRDIPFSWMLVLSSALILSRGTAHVMEVWNMWHVNYWLAEVLKVITTAASVLTAILLARLLPKALAFPGIAKWAESNAALEKEVHERRELELDLRIRESAYREQADLLELTHDAIFVRSLENKVTYWNRAAERLYGWKKDETRGKTTHTLLHTQFPRSLAEIEAELSENGLWEGELIHTRKDGSTLTVSSRWALRTDVQGKPTAVLESNRDVTQRKLAEDALRQSEERFRLLIQSVQDYAILMLDPNGIVTTWNEGAERIKGYRAEEIVGQHFSRFYPPADIALGKPAQELKIATELGRFDEEGWRVRKDGSRFWANVTVTAMRDEAGQLRGFGKVTRDITDRKRAEERFRGLLEAAPDAMVVVNQRGEIVLLNVQAEKHFGYRRDELVGQNVKSIIPAGFGERFAADGSRTAADALAQQIDTKIELIGWRKDGSSFPIEIMLSPLESAGGILVIAAIRDVTRRWRNEDQIRKLNSELSLRVTDLAAVNHELEAFSYSVSHDLRAPLRHIDGFTRILKEDYARGLPEIAISYLDRVLKAVNHMGQLVDDLLNLGRIGRKDIARQKVKLSDLVQQAREELPPGTEERNINWMVATLPEVDCDPGLIKLVFSNLLANAVKFTRKQQTPSIEVGMQTSDGVAAFFVRDNGVGFNPKYADKLFGVFQRLHSQEEFEGTGVGLATVQRIIARHGGVIWAESQPDRGATFFFTLEALPDPIAPNGRGEVLLGRV
jgi:PAS domain S-box-containing protein